MRYIYYNTSKKESHNFRNVPFCTLSFCLCGLLFNDQCDNARPHTPHSNGFSIRSSVLCPMSLFHPSMPIFYFSLFSLFPLLNVETLLVTLHFSISNLQFSFFTMLHALCSMRFVFSLSRLTTCDLRYLTPFFYHFPLCTLHFSIFTFTGLSILAFVRYPDPLRLTVRCRQSARAQVARGMEG